ncbi:MAG TPA: sigma-70 family RNA polymerase sigma factor, partial [Chitinophagales bacterium]
RVYVYLWAGKVFSCSEKPIFKLKNAITLTLKPTLKNIPDEELVDCYRNSHDVNYISELYLRYTHLVYGTCLKYLNNGEDAKDATKQIFELLVRELKKHRVTIFKTWLHGVVQNFCTMESRKNTATATVPPPKKTTKEIPIRIESVDEAHQTESEEDRKLLTQTLIRNLHTLKDEQRKCLQFFYIDKMNYNAIEDRTGYTQNEIKNYIQNGKRNLKQLIGSNGNN